MPAATTDLGYAVQNEYRQLPGLFRGSVKDTRAAISDIKCRPVGDVDIQGPPCFTNAMPKGPVSHSLFIDWYQRELHCNSRTPIFGGAMSHTDIEIPQPKSTTGFRCGSHRRSNGFTCFTFTRLQEAVVILGGRHRHTTGVMKSPSEPGVNAIHNRHILVMALFRLEITIQPHATSENRSPSGSHRIYPESVIAERKPGLQI